MTREEKVVWACLEWAGKQAAGARLTAADLAEATDLPSARVRAIVHELRMQGYLVASDTYGFWLPDGAEDVRRTVRHLWSRVREIAKVARAMTKAANEQYTLGITEAQQVEMVFGEKEIEDEESDSDEGTPWDPRR